MQTLQRMAEVVDRQNAGDPQLSADGAGIRRASRSRRLATWSSRAATQPNGYTEFILHRAPTRGEARVPNRPPLRRRYIAHCACITTLQAAGSGGGR